jgi:predicted small secreted protein
MKFKKIYLLVLISMFLTGCIQSTALLGPGVTIATTGNIMQAGFQYGANSAIKNETGKDAFTHLKDVVEEKQNNQKLEKKIKNLTQNTIQRIKKKLLTN